MQFFDATWGTDLGWLEVTGTTFSHDMAFSRPGNHNVWVTVSDEAGNRSESSINVFVDQSSPVVAGVTTPSRWEGGAGDVIHVAFSERMDVARLIVDGSITSILALSNVDSGAVSFEASQFSYDDVLQVLAISFDGRSEFAPPGFYELRLDGSRLMDRAGNLLRGGESRFVFVVETFDEVHYLQSAGSDLQVSEYSVPSLADWNADGLLDLIVGEKTAESTGKIRVYANQGTSESPVFGGFAYAQTTEGDLSVLASGCLGVFPRVYDWDADGRKDLVLGLADGHVQVALNQNTDSQPVFGLPNYVQVGSPGEKANLGRGGPHETVAIVDWNNDGHDDLVVGALDGRIRVYMNEATDGAPDFLAELVVKSGSDDIVVSSRRASIAVADLNGTAGRTLSWAIRMDRSFLSQHWLRQLTCVCRFRTASSCRDDDRLARCSSLPTRCWRF